jgi:hypothetical protein
MLLLRRFFSFFFWFFRFFISIERVMAIFFWYSAKISLYNRRWFNRISLQSIFINRKPSIIAKKRRRLNRLVKLIIRYIRVLFCNLIQPNLFHNPYNMRRIAISVCICNRLVIRRLVCFFIILISLILKYIIIKRIWIRLFWAFIIKFLSMYGLSLFNTWYLHVNLRNAIVSLTQ